MRETKNTIELNVDLELMGVLISILIGFNLFSSPVVKYDEMCQSFASVRCFRSYFPHWGSARIHIRMAWPSFWWRMANFIFYFKLYIVDELMSFRRSKFQKKCSQAIYRALWASEHWYIYDKKKYVNAMDSDQFFLQILLTKVTKQLTQLCFTNNLEVMIKMLISAFEYA